MRDIRVCIYGGRNLSGVHAELISTLAYRLLEQKTFVIVTGGLLRVNSEPGAVTTDSSALHGARLYADQHKEDLSTCFEAWVPDPTLESRVDDKGAVRMSDRDGVTVRVMTGRTPLGRRLALVEGVNAVVTISGKRHTELIVEQALDLGVPVLPIALAGGDSEELLRNFRGDIAARFDRTAFERCMERLPAHYSQDFDPQAATSAIVDVMRTARLRKCLVLLPYDKFHNALYNSTLKPVVGKHMYPVRLDHLPKSEAISGNFEEAIRSCHAVVADVTVQNESVIYEIGYAHAIGLDPLIYTRNPNRIIKLPVYIRTLNVRQPSEGLPLTTVIDDYFRSVRNFRRTDHVAVG